MRVLILLALLVFLAGCTTPIVALTRDGPPLLSQQSGDPAVETPSVAGFVPLIVAKDTSTQLQLFDLASGQPASGYVPLNLPAEEQLITSALSDDASYLAVATGSGRICRPYAGGSSCYLATDHLHLVDITAWRMVDVHLEENGYIAQLAFNPDLSSLAVVFNTSDKSSLLLYDISNGDLLARRDLSYQLEWLAYVLADQALAVYGVPLSSNPGIVQPPSPRLQLLDPTSLQPRWGLRLEGQLGLQGLLSGEWCLESCSRPFEQLTFVLWKPAVTLAPDGKRLYIIHADRDSLISIELEKGDLQNASILNRLAWLERLVESVNQTAQASGRAEGTVKTALVSPDGLRLYVLSRKISSGSNTGGVQQSLQVIDLSQESRGKISGRLLADVDLDPDLTLIDLELAPDGTLYLSGYESSKPVLQRLSPDPLLMAASLSGWQVVHGPDILLGQRPSGLGSELAVIDPLTLQVLRSWQVDGQATWPAAP